MTSTSKKLTNGYIASTFIRKKKYFQSKQERKEQKEGSRVNEVCKKCNEGAYSGIRLGQGEKISIAPAPLGYKIIQNLPSLIFRFHWDGHWV